MIQKAIAFLKKDFFIESSYRFAFMASFFSVILTLLGYFFIDKLFGSRMTPYLEEFGVTYFPYVLLSNAFFGYVGVGLGSFSDRINSEQTDGTLEAVLLTPTKITTMLFSMVLWNLAIATIEILIYVTAGIFLFGIDFSHLNILSTVTIFILTIISFSGLGILSASFTIVFKRGNPVGWLVGGLEGLIGGVYFPMTVLPAWLQIISLFFPITYAIRAIELAVYKGYSLSQLTHEICMLILFSAVILPLAFMVFSRALHYAKKRGSLSQY